LTTASLSVAADPAIRAAVLTASGDGFCSGADLWAGRKTPAPTRNAGTARTMMKQNSQRLIRTVLEVEKPIVAAVNGVAAGMGAHLALACDLSSWRRGGRSGPRSVGSGSTRRCVSPLPPPNPRRRRALFRQASRPARRSIGLCAGGRAPSARRRRARDPSGSRSGRPSPRDVEASLNRAYELARDLPRGGGLAQSLVSQSEKGEGVKAFAERRKPVFTGR
jgi:2-(1,2-epoxy-1,2-dihydrophenyl)acetyl-CoA isomerase